MANFTQWVSLNIKKTSEITFWCRCFRIDRIFCSVSCFCTKPVQLFTHLIVFWSVREGVRPNFNRFERFSLMRNFDIDQKFFITTEGSTDIRWTRSVLMQTASVLMQPIVSHDAASVLMQNDAKRVHQDRRFFTSGLTNGTNDLWDTGKDRREMK